MSVDKKYAVSGAAGWEVVVVDIKGTKSCDMKLVVTMALP